MFASLVEAVWAGRSNARRWRGLDRHALDELLRTAHLEGVLDDVYPAIRDVRTELPNWGTIHRKWEEDRTRLRSALPAISTRALITKGFALERLYPTPRRRYFTDTDAIVPTIADVWDVAAALRPVGYREVPFMLLFRDAEGRIRGVTKFVYQGASSMSADIELQIGIYPISYQTHVALEQLVSGARISVVQDVALRVPSAHQHLIVLLAELESRKKAKIRDIYDVQVLLDSDPDLRIDDVLRDAEALGLNRSFAIIRDGVSGIGEDVVSENMRTFVRHQVVQAAASASNLVKHLYQHLRMRDGRLSWYRLVLHIWRQMAFHVDPERVYSPLLLAPMDSLAVTRHLFGNGLYCYATRVDDWPRPFKMIDTRSAFGFTSPLGTYALTTNATLRSSRVRRAAQKMYMAL